MITTHAETETVEVDYGRKSQVSWGAIFAGWLVAYAIAILLYIFGAAVGLSAIDATNADASAKGLGIGTALWVLISWSASLFLGGLFASWLSGKADRLSGALHGLAVWALALMMALILGTSGMASLVAAGQSVGKGIAALAPVAGAAGIAGASKIDPNSPAVNNVMGGVQAELKEQVSQAIATRTALTRAQIDQIVVNLSERVDRAKQQLQDAANQAAKYSAGALWVAFFANVIGVLVSWLGGRMGAARWEHVYALRA